MKVLACVLAVIVTLATVSCGGYGGGGGGGYGGSSGGGGYSGGGGGYGGESVPAPPCPKNYLFSCQPNLSPVPCASSGYGSSGAYSESVPTILTAPYSYPRAPQNFYPVSSFYGNY